MLSELPEANFCGCCVLLVTLEAAVVVMSGLTGGLRASVVAVLPVPEDGRDESIIVSGADLSVVESFLDASASEVAVAEVLMLLLSLELLLLLLLLNAVVLPSWLLPCVVVAVIDAAILVTELEFGAVVIEAWLVAEVVVDVAAPVLETAMLSVNSGGGVAAATDSIVDDYQQKRRACS